MKPSLSKSYLLNIKVNIIYLHIKSELYLGIQISNKYSRKVLQKGLFSDEILLLLFF